MLELKIHFLFRNGPDCIKAIWKSEAQIQMKFQTTFFLVNYYQVEMEDKCI